MEETFFDRISKLSPKQLALLAVELQSQLEAAEEAKHEPVAIIGIGCRFPGGANDPHTLWELLRNGDDAITEVPPSRWDVDAYYDPDPAAPGKMSTRWGGFIEGVEQFDPHFFGIAPREAISIDPQHRLLLEVSWEALERAAQSPEKLMASRTGVFVGISGNDYHQLQLEAGATDAYLASGNAHSIASGRLSYLLGLQGPSLSIDTACSSSLVAIHLAVQSLRAGECRMALAGGVNLIAAPETTIALSKAQMMAPDGRCKAFDARADGFVRSEGCGIIVLKRLSDARADGDRILALVRGSAINQDGRSNGITAPNGPAQEAVIRMALADGGIEPDVIDYVESHGTGTALGDPIEVQALAAVLGEGRSPERPLIIGSVKTNLGHLESAAGVASLIKVVLALQHGTIPPHLHLQDPNPYIPWDTLPVTIPTAGQGWPQSARPRLAGVSSFGFSGTNAHIILEEAPVVEPAGQKSARPLQILTLSAKSGRALEALAANVDQHLRTNEDRLADICFTAGTGRSHFPHRLALIAASREELVAQLAAVPAGKELPGLLRGQVTDSRAPGVVFLFSGQGSHYPGMGRQLYETDPQFRAALETCDRLLRPQLDRPLLSVLYPGNEQEASLLDETEYTQPALFALEYALATLWQSWGIRPAMVMGHSVGEYVAACVAGLFSLEDALRLVAERGRLMQQLPDRGRMAAIFAEERIVRRALAPYSGRVSIAADNGPANVVISGTADGVAAIVETLGKQGIRARYLTVSHAFHSPLMEPVQAAFARAAAGVAYGTPTIGLVSNVTGKVATTEELADPDYWCRHLRGTVRFAGGMRTVQEQGYRLFLEIGPNPVLLGMGQRCLPEGAGTWLPSLRKGRDDWQQMLPTLGQLYVHGVKVDWDRFYSQERHRKVELPTYPFQRERYWLQKRQERPARRDTGPQDRHGHPLLGNRLRAASIKEIIFESRIDTDLLPFLRDHLIFGTLLLPSPFYIEMALAAAAEHFGSGLHWLENMVIHEPLILSEGTRERLQLVLRQEAPAVASFQIYSLNQEVWHLHASGQLRQAAEGDEEPDGTIEHLQRRLPQKLAPSALYDRLERLGLQFGESFRGIAGIRHRDGEALGKMALPAILHRESGAYRQIHPALLDSCFHLLGAALPEQEASDAYLLIGLERLRFYRRPDSTFWSHIRLQTADGLALSNRETFTADIDLLAESGELVARLQGLQLKRARPERLQHRTSTPVDQLLYEIAWPVEPHGRRQAGASRSAELVGPATIAGELETLVAEISQRHGIERYRAFLPELDALCAAYVIHALRDLGCRFEVGQHLSIDQLAADLTIVKRHQRLLGRMLGMLAEDGILQPVEGGWTVAKHPPVREPQAIWQQLLESYPDFEAELTLTGRCAQQLAAVLRDTVDPLQLLFPGGSLAETERLYQDSVAARTYNTLVQEAVTAALARLPAERPLRILEIGAGTGGTTAYVLPRLPAAQTEYLFTDISPLFLNRASKKFVDRPFVRYQSLDIGRDPVEQGLSAHSFDLILAANVLHATPDLRRTLAHVSRLLAPEGMLLLLEATGPERFGDLTVGLTEGWWAFTDTDLRPTYALLPQQRWIDLLTETGFRQAAAVPGEGKGVLSKQAVILARGPRAGGTTAPLLPDAARSGSWLIFADKQGVGRLLAEKLRQQNEDCLLVRPREQATTDVEETVEIDPASPEEYHRLIADLSAPDRSPCRGVIHLWGLDSALDDDRSTTDPVQAQLRSCGSLLYLVQALGQSRSTERPALWIVTRGAQYVDRPPVNVGQAPVWGLSHVVALEHPELQPVRIDLDPAGEGQEEIETLFAEIWHRDPAADQIALRGSRRHVRRLVRAADRGSEPAATWQLRADATYLITGGLGGLGLLVAQQMVAHGARNLVLMGRSEPSETAHKTVQHLEGMGARVAVIQGNVARRENLVAILDYVDRTFPPLRGIIHAAGVLSDGVLLQLDWDQFNRVMAPKVAGSWHLHTLTRGMALDFFVMFSSGASLIGSAGQGNHAAANAFMDALAHARRGSGLPGLSINWGAWAGVGAVIKQGLEKRQTITTMTPEEGLAALERLMRPRPETGRSREGQVAIFATNWQQHLDPYPIGEEPPLFREIARDLRSQPAEVTPAAGETDLRQQLAACPPNQRYPYLLAAVRKEAATALGVDSPDRLETHQPLSELGLDSLMAVELRNRLGTVVGQVLPATLLFEYPTIRALTDYLAEHVLALESVARAPDSPASHGGPGEQLDTLSEDEIADLLIEKLNRLSRKDHP